MNHDAINPTIYKDIWGPLEKYEYQLDNFKELLLILLGWIVALWLSFSEKYLLEININTFTNKILRFALK